jgi:two-component system sensor histidine kinase CpxA
MRDRIFRRIFLWFLSGAFLLVAVSVLLTYALTLQGLVLLGREDLLSQALLNQGRACLESYDQEGIEGLLRTADRIRRETRLGISVYRPDGTALNPSPFDVWTRDIVFPSLKRGETARRERGLILLFRRVEHRGEPYVLVGVMPRRPFLPFLGSGTSKALAQLAVLLLTAAAVCWGLARTLVQPVRKLHDLTRALAEGEGDLSVPEDESLTRRGDEIGDLARGLYGMARHVASLLEAQKRLIRDVSHELRSPLARLNVALALARRKAGPEAEGALDRIEREAEALNEMIRRLLSLARTEAERGQVSLERLDLAELAGSVVRDAAFEAAPQGKRVELRTPAGPLETEGNVELLRSALENVVRNAVRHTAPGSAVEVTAGREEGGARLLLRVRDHGPGVPEEERENLFRPFYRLESARDRESGGSGLGLAIARRAVRLHEGEIGARNAPEGGLIVEILLPPPRHTRSPASPPRIAPPADPGNPGRAGT